MQYFSETCHKYDRSVLDFCYLCVALVLILSLFEHRQQCCAELFSLQLFGIGKLYPSLLTSCEPLTLCSCVHRRYQGVWRPRNLSFLEGIWYGCVSPPSVAGSGHRTARLERRRSGSYASDCLVRFSCCAVHTSKVGPD